MSLNKTRKRAIARAKAREYPKIELYPEEVALIREWARVIAIEVAKIADALNAGFAAFVKAYNETLRKYSEYYERERLEEE